jgi:hypothetical protein
MDPISLITGALLAGLKDVGTQAVKDAYTGLKSLIIKRFKARENLAGETAIKKFEEKPEAWQAALEDSLKEIQIQNDLEIIEAAKKLAELAAPKQFAQGKFNVQAENIQSVTQADKIDHLTQTFGDIKKDKA